MADYHDEAERQRDIASRATEWVDEVTKFLQNRAVSPLFWIARAIIFGLLGLALVVVAGVLAVDTLVKLLDAYLFAGRVWITYFVIGGIALLVSLVAWKRMGKYRMPAANTSV
ncbi:hypothetical protein [Ferrimicrobium acidiphilum]|uniref:hypothetical protein n=1 Tax=Ferrimicrobium acidiphilum TaxID=121039 RepID=UPI0023EFE924|nr:hypothetical protein [Ferrimicrobium acidiphilum]